MSQTFEQGEIVYYEEENEKKELLVINIDDNVAKNKQVTYDYNKNPVMLQEYTDYDGDPEDTVVNCVYTTQLDSEIQKQNGEYDIKKILNRIDEHKLKLYAFHSERLQR